MKDGRFKSRWYEPQDQDEDPEVGFLICWTACSITWALYLILT